MSENETKPWWQTLPAILSGFAAIITALTGLLIAVNKGPDAPQAQPPQAMTTSEPETAPTQAPAPTPAAAQTPSPPPAPGPTPAEPIVVSAAPAPALPVRGESAVMTRKLTEADLAGKSRGELDILRNEVYARHGRRFNRSDLQAYFDRQPWYRPRYAPDQFPSSLLTPVQSANVTFIRAYQNRMP
jgi:serine/threonine-protein kinase